MQEYRLKGRTLQALKPGSTASYYEVAIIPRRVLKQGLDAAVAWYRSGAPA